MTTLRELIKLASLNLSDLIIEQGIGSCLCHDFQVSPLEFINFAKEDLSEDTTRGLINALTNAKRAVDCQIDSIYQAVGFSHDEQPEVIKAFIAWHENKEGGVDASPKLKLVRALGLAPTTLISNARLLRNKLEHYYEVPDFKLAREAVEIAELFVCAVQYKMQSFTEEFSILNAGSIPRESPKTRPCLYFSHNSKNKSFDITVFGSNPDSKKIETSSKEISYLHLIKLSMSLDTDAYAKSALHDYLHSAGINIPSHSLKVEVVLG